MKDWKSNKLADIKKYFENKLSIIYPAEEIQSIFKLLVEAKLGLTQKDLIINPDLKISESEVLVIQFALKRLLKNEPIQYILGQTEFFGLSLKVNNSVLIPRPETEELVSWVLEEENKNSKKTILDACTGSGCIALAIKKELPKAKVIGVDISDQAISVAQENALINQLKVNFEVSDVLTINEFPQADIIVSNPPYVSRQEAQKMHQNVLLFEPHIALFPDGNDDLIFYKTILQLAIRSEVKKVFFEINQYKKEELLNLLKTFKCLSFEFRKDLSNNLRFLKVSFIENDR